MNHIRRVAAGGAIAAASIAGGAIGANLVGTANAQTTTNSSSSSDGSSAQPSMPAHGSAEHESAEKPVTGDAATQAQTAAVNAVGGGTAGDVTTDFGGSGYEVTVTKTDGTKVEVHLDSSFTVEQHSYGGHGPRANDNDADDQAPNSSSTAN